MNDEISLKLPYSEELVREYIEFVDFSNTSVKTILCLPKDLLQDHVATIVEDLKYLKVRDLFLLYLKRGERIFDAKTELTLIKKSIKGDNKEGHVKQSLFNSIVAFHKERMDLIFLWFEHVDYYSVKYSGALSELSVDNLRKLHEIHPMPTKFINQVIENLSNNASVKETISFLINIGGKVKNTKKKSATDIFLSVNDQMKKLINNSKFSTQDLKRFKVLFEVGFSVHDNNLDKDKGTILHALCRNEFKGYHTVLQDMCDFVLELGCDIDAVDNTGRTALMVAIENEERYLMVDSLLKKGANHELKNYKGDTAFHIAVYKKNHNAVDSLMKYNASPIITDSAGYTPMESSRFYSDLNMTNTLQKYETNFLKNLDLSKLL